MRVRRLLLASLLTLALTTALPASAVDGVMEINQACVATGCFPGDAPGFPVEITASGSYRLTGNLEVPDLATTAIRITANDVSIDLNGFVIAGPNVCTQDLATKVVTCSHSGNGSGVDAPISSEADVVTGLRIANGAIRGMGRGLDLIGARAVHIEGVRVSSSHGTGIACSRCAVVDSSSTLNGSSGIRTLDSAVVSGNVVFSNGGRGILAEAGGDGAPVIRDNSVGANFTAGIAASGAVIIGNSVANHPSFGIADVFVGDPPSGLAANVLLSNNGGGAQIGSNYVLIDGNLCDGTPCP